MISSTSCSNSTRIRLLPALLALLCLLAGCSAGLHSRPLGEPPAIGGYRIAVLPVSNLSGSGGTHVKQLRQSLLAMLEDEGFALLGDEALEQFMTRHRVRWVGGVDAPTSRALLEETGSNAVLVINLETYHAGDPPKVALYCRLVSTGPNPEIIWMDSVALAGDDEPGVLNLGLVHEHDVLRDMALGRLVDSLMNQLAGVSVEPGKDGAPKIFRPRIAFDASHLTKGKRYTIGVLPFTNQSERKHAGEILSLQVVRQLSSMERFAVLEPGLVREKLLSSRIIMDEGISKFDLDVLSNSLGSDLMMAGKVTRYQDLNLARANPAVEFSALVMEGAKKRIVWSSASYNKGDDTVYFFDVGRISTAQETSARMVRALLSRMKWSRGEPEPEVPEEVIQMERFRQPQK